MARGGQGAPDDTPGDAERSGFGFGFGLDADKIRASVAVGRADLSTRPTTRARIGYRLAHYPTAAGVRLTGSLVRLLEPLAGKNRVHCLLCGWTGLEFRPLVGVGWYSRNSICPSCQSHPRQRLMTKVLTQATGEGSLLWLAPEENLRGVLAGLGWRGIVTADLERDDVDCRADIQALPFPDATFDGVLCSDVLEHVPDDQLGMRELARVLRPGGTAFIHVPVLATETVEYGFASPWEWGHVRSYGPDVIRRIERAGFDCSAVLASKFPAEQCHREGLLSWDAVLIGTRKQ